MDIIGQHNLCSIFWHLHLATQILIFIHLENYWSRCNSKCTSLVFQGAIDVFSCSLEKCYRKIDCWLSQCLRKRHHFQKRWEDTVFKTVMTGYMKKKSWFETYSGFKLMLAYMRVRIKWSKISRLKLHLVLGNTNIIIKREKKGSFEVPVGSLLFLNFSEFSHAKIDFSSLQSKFISYYGDWDAEVLSLTNSMVKWTHLCNIFNGESQEIK